MCRLPIDVSSGGGASIGSVADWAAEDFYTVSMEEWSKLHEIYTQDQEEEAQEEAQEEEQEVLEEIIYDEEEEITQL